LGFFILSLLGMPPLVGFAAKFRIFAALYSEGQRYSAAGEPLLATTLITLLVVGGINTVISAVYYLKVMKVMTLDTGLEDLEGRPAKPLPEPISAVAYAGVMALLVLALIAVWDPLDRFSRTGLVRYRSRPGVDLVQGIQ